MNYSRIQKWLSSFLIFSILFLQTFEVPMLSSTRAEAKTNADIVSFIVDDDIYGGVVKAKVFQYAKDVQTYLPNTRVVIFPVQKTANPFSIASINEKLFYEGDGEGLSRLVGTILIGEVPLPVVHKEEKAFMSIYPYVDFDSKSFIYDQTKKSYEYANSTLTNEKPEIWHSVIRPNTGDASKDTAELVAFLEKTHDFYNKQGLFSAENTPTEPRVFYMDTFHDQETSSPDIWKSYNLYLENIEDITYRRFNKYLAKKLYDASQGFYSIDSKSVQDPTIKSLLETYSGSTTDISQAPDITTKDIIEKSVKQFFEVLNAKYMGDVLRYVHNTGRYGDANGVRADSTPVVIAKKDLLMRTTLKDANTSMEWVVDALIKNTLAEPLKIADSLKIVTINYAGSSGSTSGDGGWGVTSNSGAKLYKNYFFGKEASTITDMNQCTIVRGSTLKVESNRGYNIKNAEWDVNFLKSDLGWGGCFPGSKMATQSYWWGNSPLNFDQNSMKTGNIVLGIHTYKNFVKPIYDSEGAKELGVTSPLHTATPLDCLDNNLLLQPFTETEYDNRGNEINTIIWPTETAGSRFSCITVQQPLLTPFGSYYDYLKKLPVEPCTKSILKLDGNVIKQAWNFCNEEEGVVNFEKTYSFKTLPGNFMEHKSPTDEEYGKALQNMVTPSLPSDRDRYADYLDKNLTYKKIVYPNFFRISLARTELNYPGALSKIKQLLDAKSAEIKTLSGSVDLYKILSSDEKALNAVTESVLWNNMKNATLKYSSTLERSLDIDGEKKVSADDRKNNYEIAYLGAPGDAKNMYLKMDPEAKNPPPKEVSDILDRANNYHGLIDGTNISSTERNNNSEFKCGPPEGVPIWEWLPAIFCWLGTILPPTISAGSCGGSTTATTEDNRNTFATQANSLDANKNGILDGYELIGSGELKFRAPEKIFGYGETVPLVAELTKDGKIIDIDSFNVVSFSIKKLSVFTTENTIAPKLVYDRAWDATIADIRNISPYMSFTPMEVRAQQGIAKYSFSTKSDDIDAVFDVHILTKDRYGKIVVDKTSKPVTISVRSERISVQSKTKIGDLTFASSSVIEAGNTNGVLFNLKKINKNALVLSENLPYTLRIFDDISDKSVHDPINVTKNEYLFRDQSVLSQAGVYRFEFVDSKGIKGLAIITVLPGLPKKIEVTPASNTFIAGEKTTVLVRVLDSFGNLAQGEAYKLTGSISGGAGFVDSNNQEPTSTVSRNIIEWYASFDITNTKTSDSMNLSFRIDRANISSETVTLRSIDFAKISLEVDNRDHITVGKEKHSVRIKMLDANNRILSGYDGVIALDFSKLSGVFTTPFVRIKNGISETEIAFTPWYVAEKNLHIHAQVPWVTAIEGDVITVLPDVPMSFSFAKQDDRMEAKEWNINHTRATLYDRYGNIAYNAIGYDLTVSIPFESQKYATLLKKTTSGTIAANTSDVLKNIISKLSAWTDTVAPITSTPSKTPGDIIKNIIAQLWSDSAVPNAPWSTSKNIEDIIKNITTTLGSDGTVSDSRGISNAAYTFSGGTFDFDIGATGLPGKAYIIGTVSPGLESNSFSVTDKSGKTLTISGISQNVTILDTYYAFNKSKLDSMRYDAQYSVLLGGEYGDVTQKEYLGGEILFNHNSKSLAVTTLLNNPWKEQDLFGFTPAGKYSLVKSADETDSLQTSIADNGTKSYISFYDSYRKEYIARAWLNLDPGVTSFLPCTSSGTDIANCDISSQTTVFMKGFDGNNALSTQGWLTLFSPNKIPLLRIDSNGKLSQYPGIELQLDEKVSSNLLGIKVVSNGAQVGYLGMKFSSNSVETTASSGLESALSAHKNSLVFEILSNRYVSHRTHLGVSSKGSEGIVFAFANTSTNEIGDLNSAYISKSAPGGLEEYPKKTGIGWEWENRMLLEVAAGTTIGSATKFYQTFSTITLGDAVSHLPRISTMSNFDRTIGTQLTVGNGEQIESYKKIDVNGDGVSDMVIFYESGKIQLLINYSGSFKDMGYLAYVSDGGIWRKGVGNFFGDGYDDIILTDAKWKLIVLDNQEGKFSRIAPIILNESGALEDLHGLIQQLEIFDMDADGKDDIVTMDDSGEINILYGEAQNVGSIQKHVFRKHLITSGLGIRLAQEIRNDGGAFSFGGLSLPVSASDSSVTNSDQTGASGAVNQAMIDNIIYYSANYQSDNTRSQTSADRKNSAIGSSVGANMKRNPDGSYAKDAQGNYIDDAGSISFSAMSGSSLTGAIDYSQADQNLVLAQEISGKIEEARLLAGSGNTDFSALDDSNRGSKKTFIRSPFAEGKGLKVEKSYKILSGRSGDAMQSGDPIRVEILLSNTSKKAFSDSIYLDSNDRKVFSEDQEGVYKIARNGGKETELPLKYMIAGDFDYGFDLGVILPGESVKIQYLVTATPVAFGKMQVGLLEKKELGDDTYGDISLSPNNMCGGELTMWRSVEPYPRSYEKGTKKLMDNSKLPDELVKNGIDTDKNGIPDYIDELIKSGKGDISLLKKYSETELGKFNIDKNGNQIPDRGDSRGSRVVSYDPSSGKIQIGGLTSGNIDAINSTIDEVVKWLGCGFGGGGCINSPLNYAPLAPGSAPTLFGFPLMPLSPGTGIPAFSMFTYLPGPFCSVIPTFWPPVPTALEAVAACGAGFAATTPLSLGSPMSAWWWLGTWSTSNFLRIFITPTITGAVGMAICYGGPANIPNKLWCAPAWLGSGVGCMPPPGASPLIPWGNCVVAAAPLMSCKDDGSDGDAGSLGLGVESGDTPSVNANACIKKWGNTVLLPEDRKNLVSYVAGSNAHLPEISASMARWGFSSISSGPLIGIGMGGGGPSDFEVSIDAAALTNFDIGNIVKIKNTRVSSFPDFLMEWATRQLEEVVNKLTSLPTLYIVLPDFSGFDIAGYKNFPDNLSKAFSKGKSADTKDYVSQAKSNSTLESATLRWAQSNYNSFVANNSDTITSVGKNVSGIKTAYEFMSRLPLIKLDTELVDISIPWLSFEEMDKWLSDAKLTQKQWQHEFADKQEKWSRLGNLSEADKKVMIQTEWLIGSLQENIRIIGEYKRFPEKLQKYLTWKERYASQLLCNIEAIEFMMGGWISDNGKRFRTWVELYILIKAILKSWQLIVDLFYWYQAECGGCANARYDLKHFLFKIISAIIPKIPIIQFPKWPDIWLDLHNIRGGLRILMPEFHFSFVPMVLPQLPRLYLPDVPTVSIGLPSLPILPSLPELPELPDLPSLPNIKLPDLPPPPTIPKLFGGIAAVLEIFKIIRKILCIMNINPFVPEWRAGDQIAQITERQGKLPIDFLNVEFPNFSLSFVDAIKVTTFVNLEFDIDFIVAMSKATLNPLNEFTNDLSNIGSIMIPDVNFRNTVPENIDINVGKQGFVPNKKATKDETMTFLLRKLSFDVVHNFMALNLYVEKHSKEEVTVAGLRDILTENISLIRAMHDPKALAIADTLQKAVTYPGNSEAKFIQDLTNQNTEKFSLLKDYVKSEKMETVRLKTEIDTILRTGTIDRETSSPLLSIGEENIKAQSLSTDNGISTDMRQKILSTNARILPSLERIQSGTKDQQAQDIKDMGDSLVSGVTSGLASYASDVKKNDTLHTLAYADSANKLLAIDSSEPAPSGTTAPVPASSVTEASATASTYQYEGIYILDKNNKQVRLFDYIDGVDGKEEVVSIDVDKDGDDDIIYRMDNSLYLKQNFDKEASVSHISDTPKTLSWQDFLHMDSETMRILAAPNHFEETFIASNEIDFSFRPANALLDNLFRFEYYDYVDRFDKIHSGENPSSVYPKTPIHKVDLIPDLSSETVADTAHIGFIGRKNILSFGRGSWEAHVTMNTYQYITPDTNGANPIIIAAGRTVYSDGGGAVISYIRDGETATQTLSIAANTNYEFLTNAKIWMKSGKLYLFKESQEQKTLNAGDLYGMPILPGTKVEISGQGFLSFAYYDGSSMRLDGPGTYQYYSLGKKTEQYSVSLSAPNDWYYAKLSSVSKNVESTATSLHLLSPQKHADTEGPLITYGDVIRVPVYQKQALNLKAYLDDISGIANVWIDMDLAQDTNGDGNTQNDKDTLSTTTTYGVRQGKTVADLDIGPFDSLFTKKIRLFAEDGIGNISSKDLTLTVYSPVPEIQSLSGSTISGNLNEVLSGEPIDIFRFRNGALTRIEPQKSDVTKTAANGTFNLLTKNTSGIVLTQSGRSIANIDERTWKITLEDTSFQTVVVPANASSPMQIQIVGPNKRIVYSEKIRLSSISKLESVSDFNTLSGTGIYILPNTGFNFIKNTLSSPNIPGGGYITDSLHKAIAGVSKEGDVYILDSKYIISYTTKDSSIILRIQDPNNTVIASILYKIDAEYILK